MKIALIGASGKAGSRVLAELLSRGHIVTAIARNAEHGLELRRRFGRGGTEVGVARARDLKNRHHLSPTTVKKHLTHIFDKVGVDNRTQLIARMA